MAISYTSGLIGTAGAVIVAAMFASPDDNSRMNLPYQDQILVSQERFQLLDEPNSEGFRVIRRQGNELCTSVSVDELRYIANQAREWAAMEHLPCLPFNDHSAVDRDNNSCLDGEGETARRLESQIYFVCKK